MYNHGITCKKLAIPAICPDIKKIYNVQNTNQHTLSETIINTIKTIDPNLRQLITTTKCEIDKTYKNGAWDYVKTLTNPYELVFSGSKKFVGRDIKYVKNNICNYNPLSRSFFKMVEMCNVFLLRKINSQNSSPIKSLHLAEGPGGFIEGLIYLRKKHCPLSVQKRDLYYGITLIDNTNTTEIPSWKKSSVFIRDNPNVIITSGADNTGNLYNLDNIKYLKSRFGNTMDLVTADGGFDFSVDYNSQEYLASRLIYCEILSAIVTLKPGGTFICKTFDLLNKLSIDFMYLLQCKFEYMFIFKPKTSRLANSEKYIICKGFRGINNTSEIEELFKVVTMFEIVDTQNNALSPGGIICNGVTNQCTYTIINSLFESIPQSFVKFINGITYTIITNQISNINYTIKLINKLNYSKLQNAYITDIIQTQKQNAIQWCNDNNMPVNK
jgi:23S rRNA U2552 (ribose-2'-O)-methylase RlmE/FtsJ